MRYNPFASVVLCSIFLATAADAKPAPMVTAATTAIIRCSSGGMRLHDQIVDLTKHEIGEIDFDDDKRTINSRHLDDAEFERLVQAWRAVAADDAKQPSEGPPPGGFFYYWIRNQDGSERWLSYANGAPGGKHYVVFSDAQIKAIDAVWPGLKAKKPSPKK